MFWLFLMRICALIAAGLTEEWYYSSPHEPNGTCDVKVYPQMRTGEQYTLREFCQHFSCDAKGAITVITCDTPQIDIECYWSPVNKTMDFPDCCPYKICTSSEELLSSEYYDY